MGNINMVCNECESTDIAIDLGRHMAWCRNCKAIDQLNIEEFSEED